MSRTPHTTALHSQSVLGPVTETVLLRSCCTAHSRRCHGHELSHNPPPTRHPSRNLTGDTEGLGTRRFCLLQGTLNQQNFQRIPCLGCTWVFLNGLQKEKRKNRELLTVLRGRAGAEPSRGDSRGATFFPASDDCLACSVHGAHPRGFQMSCVREAPRDEITYRNGKRAQFSCVTSPCSLGQGLALSPSLGPSSPAIKQQSTCLSDTLNELRISSPMPCIFPSLFFCFVLVVVVEIGFELRTLCLLNRHSTP